MALVWDCLVPNYYLTVGNIWWQVLHLHAEDGWPALHRGIRRCMLMLSLSYPVAGVTAYPVLPHTGPPGTDPLAESIPRDESASIFDPPQDHIRWRPSPRIRSHPQVLEKPSCRTLRCVYIPCILCRHVMLYSIILLCIIIHETLFTPSFRPGAASMQEHALCHSLQKRESIICSCY